MSKDNVRDSVKARTDLHEQQDQELADRLGVGKVSAFGVGKIDPQAAIDSKIPLRVISEPDPTMPKGRRETVVKK